MTGVWVSSMASRKGRNEGGESMRGVAKVLVASALIPATTGCATLQELLMASVKPPEVECTRITLESISLSGVTLGFDFSAYNPNPVGLTLEGVAYGVSFDGATIGTGRSTTSIPLSGNSSSTFNVEFTAEYAELIEAGLAALGGGNHTIRLDADVSVDTPIGPMPVHLFKESRISF